MALVVITLSDNPDGTLMASCIAHPPFPQSVLDGVPTQAQSAGALMLDALQAATSGEAAPRILLPNG